MTLRERIVREIMWFVEAGWDIEDVCCGVTAADVPTLTDERLLEVYAASVQEGNC